MLILLPPSEKKLAPARKKSLNLNNISFAKELTQIRGGLLIQHPEIDQTLTAPAHDVYSGFLYQSLDYETLSKEAKERAQKQIIIFSALYGALHLDDEISYYKFKIRGTLWREKLHNSLASLEQELIVDCRSTTYASAWVPPATNTVKIRVLTKVGGQVKVVTHMAKVTRGEVARFLLQNNSSFDTPQELQVELSKQFNCQLVRSDDKKPWMIDILANYS